MKKSILPVSVVVFMLLFAGVAGAQPSITTVLPISGPVGTPVIITGAGFNTTPGNNIVRFGTVRATITAAGINSLTVLVPAGTSNQPISVLNTVSGLSVTAAFPFTATFEGCIPLNTTSLLARANFAAGTVTRSVLFGDLDGDGKADMIATNTGTDNMSVFRNTSVATGSASFAAKADFTSGAVAGAAASGLAVGDLDGDGRLDVVVGNYNAATISVFINTTTTSGISFAPKTDIATLTNPLGIAIGDLNADGKPDIAVADYGSNRVSVYRNTSTTGVASFVSQTLTGSVSPRELAIGDMDNDGKPDLMVADEGGSVIIAFHNTSAGGIISFVSQGNFPTGMSPRGVSLGDIDGDGKLDIAVVNTGASSISVLHNTSSSGAINFDGKIDFASGTSPREVALGDIDGDGRPEMAASNNTSATLSVFRNESASGSISFAGKTDFSTGTNALGVGIADVDNDGKMDIAVTSSSGGAVGVFINASPTSPLSGVAASTVTADNVCDNSTWKTLYVGGSNGVIASIKDNGNALGIITASVYVEGQPGAVSGRRYLARHYRISPATQPTTPVRVRLYFTDAELLALEAVDPSIQSVGDISITRYSGTGEDGVYNPAGGIARLIPSSDIATGFGYGAHYLEFSTDGFSEFWLHSGIIILPVNLTSFTADKKPGGVQLNWSTAGEENTDHFLVERSADGISYSVLGNVTAAGNASSNRSYSFTDGNPLPGNNYYRLQQADRDGRTTQSNVLMVNWSSGNKVSVAIAYQSVRQVRATINGKVKNGNFTIFDGNGRQLRNYRVNTADAGSVLIIDLSAYASGIYLYRLVTEQGIVSGKIATL